MKNGNITMKLFGLGAAVLLLLVANIPTTAAEEWKTGTIVVIMDQDGVILDIYSPTLKMSFGSIFDAEAEMHDRGITLITFLIKIMSITCPSNLIKTITRYGSLIV